MTASNTGIKCAPPELARFVYDFDVLGGAVGAYILGKIPKDAIVKDVTCNVVAACTGGATTVLSVGNTTAVQAYITSQAIASFTPEHAVFGAKKNAAEINYSCNTDDKADVVFSIEAEDMTAGVIEIYVHYFIPKHSTSD